MDERLAALHTLIRDLYRGRRAEEIIETFSVTLAAHDLPERAAILDYWIDFYRLRRYQRDRKRRRASYRERTISCSACGYPASQRHHLWDIATHGENRVTLQLCANCHELLHLIYNALVKDSEHSRRLALHIAESGRLAPGAFDKLLGWCQATIQYEAQNGWLDGERASPGWVALKFGEDVLGKGRS
jgi:ribosomal protein L37E